MSSIEEEVERMLADGKITQHDADEIENFAAFLSEAPLPTQRRSSPEARKQFREAYAKYYPDDYARAVAELEEQP